MTEIVSVVVLTLGCLLIGGGLAAVPFVFGGRSQPPKRPCSRCITCGRPLSEED